MATGHAWKPGNRLEFPLTGCRTSDGFEKLLYHEQTFNNPTCQHWPAIFWPGYTGRGRRVGHIKVESLTRVAFDLWDEPTGGAPLLTLFWKGPPMLSPHGPVSGSRRPLFNKRK